MPIPEAMRANLQAASVAFGAVSEETSRTASMANGYIGTIAWTVGVVTPGFIGLLFESHAMAERTHLPPDAFAALVISAELAFLASIAASVILYGMLAGLVQTTMAHAGTTGRLVVAIHLALAADSVEGTLAGELQHAMERLGQDQADRAEAVKSLRRHQSLTVVFNWTPLLGYALLLVVIASQYFK